MWLARGIQSAVFYYATCTPCADARYRRKRRKDALRSQKERQQMLVDQPEAIHQPVPFETNRYWAEEIAMGPGPPPKLNKKGHGIPDACRKEVSSAGESSSKHGGSAVHSGLSGSTIAVDGEESRLSVIKENIKGAMTEKWNWKRYQREDEILWGPEWDRLTSLWKGKGREREGSKDAISYGRPRAGTGESKESSYTYYVARNPEINDLHPPVVSNPPHSKAENRWLLQTPPSAKIMEGKARGGLHSAGSSIRKRPDVLPSKKQEELFLTTSDGPSSQKHDRDPSTVFSPDTLNVASVVFPQTTGSLSPPNRKSRPPPICISKDPFAPTLTLSEVRHPEITPLSPTTKHSPIRRPPLATIASTSSVNPHLTLEKGGPEFLIGSPAFNSRSSSPAPYSPTGQAQERPRRDSDPSHPSLVPASSPTRTSMKREALYPSADGKEFRFPGPTTAKRDSHVSESEIGSGGGGVQPKAAAAVLTTTTTGTTDFATGNVSSKVVSTRPSPPPWRWSMDI